MRKALTLLCLAAFVVCACNTPQAAPTAVTVPSTPTQTLHPTRQPSEPPAPTASPSPLPSHTPTPSPTATPAFPYLASEFEAREVYPTPIATPDLPVSAYRLKGWTDSDASDLVRLADQYAVAADVETWAYKRSGIGLMQAQHPARAAVQEALLRFPASPDAEMWRWRLAMADVVIGSPASDAWVLNEIEKGLNAGSMDWDNLDAVLNQRGFRISPLNGTDNPFVEAADLFGDGQPARIFKLDAQSYLFETNLVFAVHQDERGKFLVEAIKKFPSSALGGPYLDPDISDHLQDINGDGLPEFLVELGEGLFLFQWQDNHFVDLSLGEIWSGEYRKFQPIADDSGHYLDFSWREMANPFEMHQRYRWNGLWYEAYTFQVSLPEPYTFDSLVAWPPSPEIPFVQHRQYDDAVNLLQEWLNTWDESRIEEYGPSFPDYLRFQLGLVYALQGKTAEAHSQFRSLADAPVNPAITAIPQAARRFLQYYDGSMPSVLRSYRDAQDYLTGLMEPFLEANGTISSTKQHEVLGFSLGISYDASAGYYGTILLERLLASLTPAQASDLPATLQQFGLNPSYSLHQDVDGDGIQDWIVGLDGFSSLWLVLPAGDDVQVTPLGQGVQTQVEVVSVPGEPHPALILREMYEWGDSLDVVSVRRNGGGVLIDNLLGLWDVVGYEVVQENGQFRVLATISADISAISFMPLYRWNPAGQQFIAVDYPAELLFSGGQPAAAIPVLEQALEQLKQPCPQEYCPGRDEWIGRYRYLLALAHKLSGDEANGVQTYRQLWYDSPASPYALLARAKLDAK